MKKKAAAVAMSGGTDSSLAAALLVEEGYEVVGATLQLRCTQARSEAGWARSCCAASSVARAEAVAHALGIPHLIVNAEEIFERDVIGPFRRAYLEGRTPNPCVECNARVKFGFLLEKARSWGFGCLATGHYARTGWDSGRKRAVLLRGLDQAKDQSYVLWRLTEDQLRSVLFPVGHLTKREVLAQVHARGLPGGGAPESQDVCFAPGGDYVRWLEGQVPETTGVGWIRDTSGRILGAHRGIYRYTVGQRRGLGLASREPLYVVRIDAEDNSVVVGGPSDLMSDALVAGEVNLISPPENLEGTVVSAKIRYQHTPSRARLRAHPEGLRVEFLESQRAVTPGQSVVFYRDEEVVGGGVIRRALTRGARLRAESTLGPRLPEQRALGRRA